jgi:hypothetical protein
VKQGDRSVVAVAAWLVALAAVLVVLPRVGGADLAFPPWRAVPDWLAVHGPAVAVMAVVRLGALVAAWYLLALTSLAAVLRAVHAAPAAAVVERALPAAVRRLLRTTATLTAATTLATSAASGAGAIPAPLGAGTMAGASQAVPAELSAAPRPAGPAITTPPAQVPITPTSTHEKSAGGSPKTTPPEDADRPSPSPITMRRLPDVPSRTDGESPPPSGAPTGSSTTTTSPAPATTAGGQAVATPEPTSGAGGEPGSSTAARPGVPTTMQRLPDVGGPSSATASPPEPASGGPETTAPPPAATPPTGTVAGPAPELGARTPAGTAPITVRRLPDADVPATNGSTGGASETPELHGGAGSSPAGPTGTVTARPGDSLWRIAEAALRDAWPTPPSDEAIDPYWRALVATNRARLRDPGNADLIRPGDEFVLPPVPVPDV